MVGAKIGPRSALFLPDVWIVSNWDGIVSSRDVSDDARFAEKNLYHFSNDWCFELYSTCAFQILGCFLVDRYLNYQRNRYFQKKVNKDFIVLYLKVSLLLT